MQCIFTNVHWTMFAMDSVSYFAEAINYTMDKLKLTGLNLGQVFNYRYGHASTKISTCTSSKQPNLKLKTRHKPVLCSLLLAFAHYDSTFKMFHEIVPQTSKDYRLLKACLVCFISTVNSRIRKRRKEAYFELRQQRAHKQT